MANDKKVMRADQNLLNEFRGTVPGQTDEERLANLMSVVNNNSQSDRVTTQTEGGKTKQVVLSETVDPGTRVKVREFAPISGVITSIAFNFPAGTIQNVEVSLDKEDQRIVPGAGSFLSLDDSTPVLPTQESIDRTEDLVLTIRNRDPNVAHSVTAIINITQNPSSTQNLRMR